MIIGYCGHTIEVRGDTKKDLQFSNRSLKFIHKRHFAVCTILGVGRMLIFGSHACAVRGKRRTAAASPQGAALTSGSPGGNRHAVSNAASLSLGSEH